MIDEPPERRTVFEDSRRLTGPNRYFTSTGAVLDVITAALGSTALDPAAQARWQRLARSMCAALGWPGELAILPHQRGTLLAIAAPADQLFTTTEVNEWAWEQASGVFSGTANFKNLSLNDGPFDQVHSLGVDFSAALVIFQMRAATEKNAAMTALLDAAKQHGLPVFVDDTSVSIGAGAGSRTWQATALPAPAEVHWSALYNIPTVLVTGSNGKTTTVRLLAAMLTVGGRPGASVAVGYSCTEGVVVGSEQVESGDYSGPAGARAVLRHPDAQAAVLETARGGILRRGLAVENADVAIITNISADHFGEYGIDNMDNLADVKLVVARALKKTAPAGTLVLNADDPVLLNRAADVAGCVALFALDDNNPHLVRLRESADAATCGATCAVRAGDLLLTRGGVVSNLGKVAEMPLTLGGVAAYNIANIAAASLAAAALGVDAATIAHVLTHFGENRQDNPGRLERWTIAGITVLIDYAHNPDGLANLLRVSQSIQHQPRGRLGLLLGQAGNREDDAINELAHVAAAYKPDLVMIKEIASMLRGREWGAVPHLLQAALTASAYAIANIRIVPDEVNAARELLQWAQAGDVLVLPIHQKFARTELIAMLDAMVASQWQVGSPLPARLDFVPHHEG